VTLDDLTRDNRSGASAIARALAERLSELAASSAAADPGSLWDEIEAACRAVVGAHREMAPVVHVAGRVLAAAERAVLSGLSVDAVAQTARVECELSAERADEALAALARHGAALLRERAGGAPVVTTSASAAVAAIIRAAAEAGAPPRVLLSESRPALEGVAFAEALSRGGSSVALVTDAALPGLARGAGLVLVGADSVSESDFVNKVGTYPLALAAREAGVPLYVAAPPDRFIAEALRGRPDRPRDGAEILPSPPPGVSVENRSFEIVPLSLAAGLITEDGVKDPREAAALVGGRAVPPALLRILFSPRVSL